MVTPAGRCRTDAPGCSGLIAATVLHHHLRLVTRNTVNFDVAGLETIDSWSGEG